MSFAKAASSIDINERLATLGLFQQYNPATRSKFTARARELFRRTGGWVAGVEILDASTRIAYNPGTGRFVPRKSLYRNDGLPRPKLVNDIRVFLDRQIDRVIDTADAVTFDYGMMQLIPGGAAYVLEKLPAGMKFMITTKEASNDQSQYDKLYAFNLNTRVKLIERLSDSFEVEEGAVHGSDEEIYQSFTKRGFFTIQRMWDSGQIEGAFFPYTLNYPLPLERYGIHTELRAESYKESCFILALRASGFVTEDTIATIKTQLKGTFVPHNKMRTICERFNLNVEIVGAHKNNTTHFKCGGDSPTIRLGLIAKHYFLNEKTEVTRYAIEHAFELMQRTDLTAPWYHCLKNHAG